MADQIEPIHLTESQGTLPPTASSPLRYGCAQGYSMSDGSGSSSGTLYQPLNALTRAAHISTQRATGLGITSPEPTLQLSPVGVRSSRPLALFARLRRETGGGWVSDRHAAWGSAVRTIPPIARPTFATGTSITDIPPRPRESVEPLEPFSPRLRSPVRFRTAEHNAGLRDDSDEASDEAPPSGSNYLDQLHPPVSPPGDNRQVSDPTPREEAFTYICRMTTSKLLIVCRARGFYRGERRSRGWLAL